MSKKFFSLLLLGSILDIQVAIATPESCAAECAHQYSKDENRCNPGKPYMFNKVQRMICKNKADDRYKTCKKECPADTE